MLTSKKIVIFASGSGTNAENLVRFFEGREDVKVACIMSNNPNAYVLQRAHQLGVPSRVFNRQEFSGSDVVLNHLKELSVDLIVLAGFLWLVPPAIVAAYPKRILNIHPALLPKYGGKGMYGDRVHEAVVANCDAETGITIHYVDDHYDEGDVVFQARCSVMPGDDAAAVAHKIHQLEYAHFPVVVDAVLKQV
ncbi:phosphoribosylglycinamide formyltransferase-1 [Breznakibacter xylanolyticus]|uniref:Phosphoribosylglycinamide formyltransferase n=1 Tax=Breznakibacter xylanolyticus TaxID=990 RepID=A0A2W7P5L0_9BACT|nr:phosphoribosylglycinamide formyltransferase [Breznakibacter xylanolyticus]PZX20646.1 phosphoribosylglycinamide formyltransferase-1 [Breznakibacter xylanolyticus]